MDENKTHVNKRARSAVRRYLATYFGERDLEGVLSMLSSHATGFGSGEQEVFLTPGQVPRGFEEDIRNMMGPIHYDILTEVYQPIDDDRCLVALVMDLEIRRKDSLSYLRSLRQSILLNCPDDVSFTIEHLHVSLPHLEEDPQVYPTAVGQIRTYARSLSGEDPKAMSDLLHSAASIDELTGLYNRDCFMRILTREISRSGRSNRASSCLFLDLDSFSIVNEHYGRQFADRILQRFASFLKEYIRIPDVPARIYGDGFAILLPETDKKQSQNVADRLLKRLLLLPLGFSKESGTADSLPNSFTGEGVSLSFSYGITELAEDDTPQQVLERAEGAMQRMKDVT